MRTDELILYDDNRAPYIKTFHSVVLPAKRIYNEHHHTECELSVFVEGEGVYSTRDKEYPFKPSDVFIFGSNEEHCITSIRKKINLLNIQFEPRILWEHSENIELLKVFSSRNDNFSHRFPSGDTVLSGRILAIEKELHDKETGYEIQVKYLLLSALIHIMRHYDCIQNDAPSVGTVTAQLKNAMVYMDHNLENQLTLKDIADIACMSPSYFSAVFKKFNGLSPWEYITIKRVEMAVGLLKTGKMTKLEVAEKCGFLSSSNFYKAFSRITGKTPSYYSGQR